MPGCEFVARRARTRQARAQAEPTSVREGSEDRAAEPLAGRSPAAQASAGRPAGAVRGHPRPHRPEGRGFARHRCHNSGPNRVSAPSAMPPRPVRISSSARREAAKRGNPGEQSLDGGDRGPLKSPAARPSAANSTRAPRSSRSTSIRPVRAERLRTCLCLRFERRDRTNIDDPARGDARDHDVDRLGHTQQQRPYRQPVGGRLQQVEGDVGGVEVGITSRLAVPLKPAVGHRPVADRLASARHRHASRHRSPTPAPARGSSPARARILRAESRVAGAETGM